MGFKERTPVTIGTLYFTTYGYILIKLTALGYILYEKWHYFFTFLAWFKMITFADLYTLLLPNTHGIDK